MIYTYDQLKGIAAAVGIPANQLDICAAIALGESGGNDHAYNGKPPDGSYGLFQINMIGNLGAARRQQFGLPSNEALFDAATNAHCMAIISSGGTNWHPWGAYTNGSYLKYLPKETSVSSFSPNRSSPLHPIGIVIHSTEGAASGAISWLRNPQSQASAHFVIDRTGAITQLVPLPGDSLDDGRCKAWHAMGANPYYIGVEHESFDHASDWDYRPMLAASAHLSSELCKRFGIPIQSPPDDSRREGFKGILGHRHLGYGNNHVDPGQFFPWAHYIALMKGENPVPAPVPAPAGGQLPPWPGNPSAKYGGFNAPEFDGHEDGYVAAIQEALNRTNLQPKLVVTRRFDPATEAAVRGFQGAQCPPVDGIVGPNTYAALKRVAG